MAPPTVIDLSSDDEQLHAQPRAQVNDVRPAVDLAAGLALGFVPDPDDMDPEIVDDIGFLATIPDIDVAPDRPALGQTSIKQEVDAAGDEMISQAACLQMILNVLPDISVAHVLQLIYEKTQDETRTSVVCEGLVSDLLDGGPYPKELRDDENERKRKRKSDSVEFEDGTGNTAPGYAKDATDLLKDEFLRVPARYVDNMLSEHKTFYKTYLVLEKEVREYNVQKPPFAKLKHPRSKKGIEYMLIERGSSAPKELQAAKAKCEKESVKRRKAEEEKRAEEDNVRQAQRDGMMSDCQCCFDEFPMNRMVSCDADEGHFFCTQCIKNYVGSEMGSSRCRPVCFGDPNCKGTFTRKQLQRCLSTQIFERLERLQQLQDLAAAGLDFLSDCPFCDFKAECLPVEQDKEFRCQNPKCYKTSCRLCQKETHIPLSCEEAKKDEKITIRHIVEEAMTAALIRHCNSCKHPFVKEYGCNKMTCSHCNNIQCYVCSKNVRNYSHFEDARGVRGCPLHDNVETRHEEEVKKAADEAMAKVRAENPDMSEADLLIQVSDRVKSAEAERLGRAQAAHEGFGYHMVDGALVRNAIQAVPMPMPMPMPIPQLAPQRPPRPVPPPVPLMLRVPSPPLPPPQRQEPNQLRGPQHLQQVRLQQQFAEQVHEPIQPAQYVLPPRPPFYDPPLPPHVPEHRGQIPHAPFPVMPGLPIPDAPQPVPHYLFEEQLRVPGDQRHPRPSIFNVPVLGDRPAHFFDRLARRHHELQRPPPLPPPAPLQHQPQQGPLPYHQHHNQQRPPQPTVPILERGRLSAAPNRHREPSPTRQGSLQYHRNRVGRAPTPPARHEAVIPPGAPQRPRENRLRDW